MVTRRSTAILISCALLVALWRMFAMDTTARIPALAVEHGRLRQQPGTNGFALRLQDDPSTSIENAVDSTTSIRQVESGGHLTDVVVRNALTRQPITKVRIRIFDWSPNVTAEERLEALPLDELTTDSQGRATTCYLVERKTYEFIVDLTGYFDTHVVRTMEAGCAVVSIDVEPHASLSIHTIGPDGQKVSRSKIALRDETDGFRFRGRTDNDGKLRIRLRPGHYVVRGTDVEMATEPPRTITVRRGTHEELRLSVDRLVTVIVHATNVAPGERSELLLSKSDRLTGGWRQLALDGPSWDTLSAKRDETGAWRFERIMKGRYTLAISSTQERPTCALDVTASQAEEHYYVTFSTGATVAPAQPDRLDK